MKPFYCAPLDTARVVTAPVATALVTARVMSGLALLLGLASACHNKQDPNTVDGNAEEAGEEIDDAAEDVEDAAEDAADETEDAVDDAD